MTAIVRIISAATLLAVLACGDRVRLNGTYRGVRPFKTPPGADSFVTKQLATVTLTVRPDGTADLSDSGIPTTGRIDYGFNEATYVPLTVAGVAVERQDPKLVDNARATLKANADGTWTYKGTLRLVKVSDSTSNP
jgi:hypothetical protein